MQKSNTTGNAANRRRLSGYISALRRDGGKKKLGRVVFAWFESFVDVADNAEKWDTILTSSPSGEARLVNPHHG